jgi:hypothetical protein
MSRSFLTSKHRSSSTAIFGAEKNAHGTPSQALCPVHAYAPLGVPSFDARIKTASHGVPFGSARRLLKQKIAEGPDFIDANAKMAVLKSSPRGISLGGSCRLISGAPSTEGPDFISAESTLVTLKRAPGGLAFSRSPRSLRKPMATESCAFLSQEAATAAVKATLCSGPGGVAFGNTKRSFIQATPPGGPGYVSADAKYAVLKTAPRGVAWGSTPRFGGAHPGGEHTLLKNAWTPRLGTDSRDRSPRVMTRSGLVAPLRTSGNVTPRLTTPRVAPNVQAGKSRDVEPKSPDVSSTAAAPA